MDDDGPARGKMGPAGYSASLRAIREATVRSDLPEIGDAPPEFYADDRAARRRRRIEEQAEADEA